MIFIFSSLAWSQSNFWIRMTLEQVHCHRYRWISDNISSCLVIKGKKIPGFFEVESLSHQIIFNMRCPCLLWCRLLHFPVLPEKSAWYLTGIHLAHVTQLLQPSSLDFLSHLWVAFQVWFRWSDQSRTQAYWCLQFTEYINRASIRASISDGMQTCRLWTFRFAPFSKNR